MPKKVRHGKMFLGDERKAKRLFQELPFYNAPMKKSYIKRLSNIDLLRGFPSFS